MKKLLFVLLMLNVSHAWAQKVPNMLCTSQFVVHITHKIRAILVDFVVVGISTTVATKLFVLATHNFFSTF